MKKGCIIAAIVVAVLAIIGIGVGVYFVKTKGMDFANSGAIFAVEMSIAEYQKANPEAQVAPTNEAWAKALEGFKIPGGAGNELDQFVKGGKILDIYQNEMGISQAADGSIKVTSAGPDGILGNEDDVDSSMIGDLMQKAEGAATQ